MALLLATPAAAQESPTLTLSPTPTSAIATPDSETASGRRPRLRPVRRKHVEGRWDQDRRRQTRIEQGCSEFSHTQTYLTWGPALAYSEPVTVVYQGERCTSGEAARAHVTVDGTATVYRGPLVQGEPIDSRPFLLSGTWDRPSNEVGWPLAWWGCGVKDAAYRWEIPGVYVFDVAARWGLWTLTVSTQPVAPLGEARTVHWSYNGCGSP